MEIKTPTRFEAFKDGVCAIHAVGNDNQLICPEKLRLYFSNRVIGAKRFYAARAAQAEISRIIRTPQRKEVSPKDAVVINGTRYEIVQIQPLWDTNPQAMDITLRQVSSVGVR